MANNRIAENRFCIMEVVKNDRARAAVVPRGTHRNQQPKIMEGITMIIIPIFAKKRTAGDGKTFYNYLATITKKDGTEIKVQVKFRMSCGMPDAHECPRMIGFEKKDGNLVTKEFDKEVTTDAGTETRHIVQNTLWLSAWTDCGEYVDNSLDDIAE